LDDFSPRFSPPGGVSDSPLFSVNTPIPTLPGSQTGFSISLGQIDETQLKRPHSSFFLDPPPWRSLQMNR